MVATMPAGRAAGRPAGRTAGRPAGRPTAEVRTGTADTAANRAAGSLRMERGTPDTTRATWSNTVLTHCGHPWDLGVRVGPQSGDEGAPQIGEPDRRARPQRSGLRSTSSR